VKSEQLSNVDERMPTRLHNGEGRVNGEAIDTCTRFDPPGVLRGFRQNGRPLSRGSICLFNCSFTVANNFIFTVLFKSNLKHRL
jgi:hypothetical protein